MFLTARLFFCCRCHAQVMLCSHCDHGHRYCLAGCAELAREASLERARKKYQSTWAARVNNALRQKRFREKQRQLKLQLKSVTDQGSQPTPPHDVLESTVQQPKKPQKITKIPAGIVCHRCHCVCDAYLRSGFINSNRFVGQILHQ